MRKNNLLVGMFAMAALTFAACSNEELPAGEIAGGDGTTEVVEGVPTYARFSFKLNGTHTRATTPGSTDEQAVKNIHVYVFSNGIFEGGTSPAGTVVNNSTGVFHSEALKLTSGLKNILVVANIETSWFPQPTVGTSLATFQNQLMELYTTPGRIVHEGTTAVPRVGEGYKNLQGTDKPADNGYLMANSISESSFTLKPGVSQSDAEQNSYPGGNASDYNHFDISLQRVTAKMQVTYDDADALVYEAPVGDLSNKVEIGKLTSPYFTVRNLPKNVYLFKHSNADSPLLTPFYTATNTTSGWGDFSIFDEVNVPDITIAAKDAPAPGTMYIPENANAVPVIGNTSYIVVKGTFEPNKDLVITGYDASGKPEHAYAGSSDAITTYTNAPAWGSEIYAVPASVTGEADRVKYGLQTTLKAYLLKVGLKDYLGRDENNPYYDGVLGKNVYYSIALGAKDGIYNTAIVSKNVEKDNNSGYDTTPIETIKFLQYENGTTYYRINIQDNTYLENNNLYYSVTRNNFYNVNIQSISGLGYPSEGDVTVEPETPISQTTYMQAHITVEPWKVINQGADLN